MDFISFENCNVMLFKIRQSLDVEQGIQWIKAERLPAFIDSDCYLEYRLSKLLSQVW